MSYIDILLTFRSILWSFEDNLFTEPSFEEVTQCMVYNNLVHYFLRKGYFYWAIIPYWLTATLSIFVTGYISHVYIR